MVILRRVRRLRTTRLQRDTRPGASTPPRTTIVQRSGRSSGQNHRGDRARRAGLPVGVPGDPDGNEVTVKMTREDTDTQVFSRAADRSGTGLYSTALLPSETSIPGPVVFTWTYAISAVTT